MSDLGDALRKIALKACSLSDRAGSLSDDDPAPASVHHSASALIQQRLEFWSQKVGKGDDHKFQKRLSWDDFSLEQARLLVSDGDEIALPSTGFTWIKTLEQVIQTARSLHNQPQLGQHRAFDAQHPIPFQELLLPCLLVAQHRLQHLLREEGEAYNTIFTQEAQRRLERHLLNWLALLFTPTLMKEFSQFRSSGNALEDYFNLTLQGKKQREQYQKFIEHHLEEGLLSLFEQYSVLARLAVTRIEFWAEATAELVTRLNQDWWEINNQFSPDQPLSHVVTIQAGASDPHSRGHTVAILVFDTGLKLVYKPKNLGLEIAFGNLLRWCNEQGGGLDFYIPQVINRSSYGWVKFIAIAPCQSQDGLRRFYQRSGMLVALVYLLAGNDCHYENLIAHGEYPVLVDTETLNHPYMNSPDLRLESDGIREMREKLLSSVLPTGLLPYETMFLENDLIALDMSGLAGMSEVSKPRLRCQNINTDGMTLDYEETILRRERHLPKLGDNTASAEDFVEEIITGFEQVYRLLMGKQKELLSDESPLKGFANQQARLLFRNTKTYGGVLRQSCEPEHLENGVVHSLSLELLSRAYVTSAEKPDYWSIFAAEKQDLEQLDIPMFTVNTSSRNLPLSTGTVIPDLFEASGFERMMSRVQSLHEENLQLQCHLIRLSFASRFFREPKLHVDANDKIAIEGESFTAKRGIEAAIAIAQTLEKEAFPLTDGAISWFGMTYQHRAQSFQLRELQPNLHDGYGGVALFFAALFRVTDDSHWRDVAQKTIQPIRFLTQLKADDRERVLRRFGIGGITGVGSLLYCLSHLSQWLDDVSLQHIALELSSCVTPEKIRSDEILDVVGGTAGYLLGLLALAEAVSESESYRLLELATVCGEHLLAEQVRRDGSLRAWKTGHEQQLTGFSQGAAGIAYALLRLSAVTEDERFLESAQSAIAQEQSLFSPEAQNWQDLRENHAQYQVSWAQGAAGIALARLGGLSVLDTPEIREHSAIGLQTTQKHLVWGVDSLCWGTMGRVETLLVGAETLHDPNLFPIAEQATVTVLNQAQDRGSFRLFDSVSTSVTHLGFFHGLSGIGYSCLRVAFPQQLPCVLLLGS
ncbi:Lanthionine synthetase C family protein [Halothece sp. PCC 7418]|uniref:type 2 lanthipeptide synthetase LanM family protein n=1 Tax=Halothece sp. (strain PCC 7418) TaxID=65093 RepID=UPI0002A0689B|nr:type 2 lanthipeptide synthetase LanM family protein [Halothece sp. PCC 7418]AFZ42433.1 Lanthionine synthetase C family protein [Halothece sp. PCC 7418]